mgnify:FL=1
MINRKNINTVTKEHPFINPSEIVYKVIDKDGNWFSIPHEEKNTDYQEILKWVADGNTIQEAD